MTCIARMKTCSSPQQTEEDTALVLEDEKDTLDVSSFSLLTAYF